MVSFVVPVYNVESYLRECIDSIRRQSVTDLEILLVDDGSTDSSPAICDQYAALDSRIRVIHQPNAGLSAARNTGTAHATGDYIIYVDSDDAVHPLLAETLLSIIGDSDIAIAQHITGTHPPIHYSLFPVTSPSNPPIHYSLFTITSKEAILRTLYQRGMQNSACGKLIRSSLAKKIPFTPGILYEDLDWFYRLYEATSGPIVSTTAKMYFYRDTPGSIINDMNPRRLDVLAVVDRIEAHYADDPELLRAARDRKFAANFNMFLLTAGHPEYSDPHAATWRVIRAYRRDIILNHSSRPKNRLGALLSYLGPLPIKALAKIYK